MLSIRAALVVPLAVVIAATSATAGYVDAVLADNPVAYWRFEDGSAGDVKPDGSAAADATGAHGGTYRNGVLLVQGALDGTAAASFDGISDYVTTTTLGSFGSTLGSGSTLEFWVRTTENRTIRQAMGVLNQADSTGFVVDFNRTSTLAADPPLQRFNYYVRAADGKALSTHTRQDNYRDDQWHHMAWVVNNPATNDVDLYMDGQLISQGQGIKQSPTNFSNFQFPFMIGADNNRGNASAHTNAVIDEVAIYDYPLTGGQIAAHYDAQRATLPVEGDVVLHLAGDYVDTASNSSAGNAIVQLWNDLSGNANHAVQNINSALRPIAIPNALNGHQVVRFQHDDIMDMDSLYIGPDATILMVTQNQGQTSGGSIHRTVLSPRFNDAYAASGAGYGLGYFRAGSDAFNVSLGNGSAEQKITDYKAPDGAMELITYRHTGTTGELARDGEPVARGSHTRTSGFDTGYSIGRQAGNSQRGYQGDIAEVIVYNRALTGLEQYQIGSYLNDKYALGNPAFAPLPVDGDVALHLVGDFVTTDGDGKVATWDDLSGSGNHAVQDINLALRPTPVPNALNGHQVVRFEHEDIMDMNDLYIAPEATILMVTQNQGQTSGGSIHRTVMSPRGQDPYTAGGRGYALGYFRAGSDAFNVSLGNGSVEQKVTHYKAADGAMELITYRHVGTTGELLRNAELVATGSHSRTTDFWTAYSIGRQPGNSQRGYQGDIAEVVVYNRALSPDEYHQVGFYLDQKYALGIVPYQLRASLDYRNYSAPDQTWNDAGLLNNDGVLGTSAGDTAGDPAPGFRGLVFDPAGGGDLLTIPRSASLNLGDIGAGADMSIELWAKTQAMDDDRTFIDTRDSTYVGWLLKQDHTDPSKLNLWLRTSGGQTREFISEAGALDIGDLMHHIAVTLDAQADGTGTVKFYVDGIMVGEQGYTGVSGHADSTYPFSIGHQANVSTGLVPFDGDIGLFRLWAATLTDADVLASYQADLPYYAPEPASLTLLALGALALLRRRRRA